MDDFLRKLIERLPLDFRVLFRQFFLRVIDLEALSIEADVERFLGQFAGVLIMLSLVHSLVLYVGRIVFAAKQAKSHGVLLAYAALLSCDDDAGGGAVHGDQLGRGVSRPSRRDGPLAFAAYNPHHSAGEDRGIGVDYRHCDRSR